MIWVDSLADIDNNIAIAGIPCYSDPVYNPNDILLQANYGLPLTSAATYQLNIIRADGTSIEILSNGNPYIDVFNGQFTLNTTVFNYTNMRFNNYTPSMVSAGCFCLELIIFDGSTVFFHKYTQRYTLRSTIVLAGSATISGATTDITLCDPLSNPDLCQIPNVIFESSFDCIDAYTGQYYGTTATMIGNSSGNVPFNYIKRSNIEGFFRSTAHAVKRTISLNCRTQRTEKTDSWTLSGGVLFPQWKKNEIQDMLLGNHLYINGKEYQSEGGSIFKPLQRLYNCQQFFQLSMEFIGCYEWQVFGCTPVCTTESLYFLIP